MAKLTGVLAALVLSRGLFLRARPAAATRNLRFSSMSTPGSDGTAAVVEKRVKDVTLAFCRRKNGENGSREVLLGMKKVGFGKGKWNGFGGKVEAGETPAEGAKRELMEEADITALELSHRGILTFTVPSYPAIMRTYVYEAILYEGTPKESDEMRPRWFNEDNLPYKDMWADDAYWMPLLLAGKYFKGEFDYSDEETITTHTLNELSASPSP